MLASLLILLSFFGLLLVGAALGAFNWARRLERRPHGSLAEVPCEERVGGNAGSDVVYGQTFDPRDIEESNALIPLVEVIETQLYQALSALPSGQRDHLAKLYGLKGAGHVELAEAQKTSFADELRRRESRLAFSRELEGIIEDESRAEAEREAALQKVLQLVRAERHS